MRLVTALVAAVAAVAALATSASGGHGGALLNLGVFHARLAPVAHDPTVDAGSNAAGSATLVRFGGRVLAQITVRGVTPSLPHAMHIHGKNAPELARCPRADRRDDIVDDGLIQTAEGVPDYGRVLFSLTRRGETTPAVALDLARFRVATRAGTISYRRFLQVPAEIAVRLRQLAIVVHGHDLNGNGIYDGPASNLGVPLEAELPVACGAIGRSLLPRR